MNEERKKLKELIHEAKKSGARKVKACEVVGISERTLQRWHRDENNHDGRLTPSHKSKNTLTDIERQHILNVCNEAQYAHLPSNKIVPLLVDKGVYIASEAIFYRVLKEAKQLRHRLNSRPRKLVGKPRALELRY